MKKTLETEVLKEIAEELTDEYDISIARACCLMEIYRSYFYYESVKDDSNRKAVAQEISMSMPAERVISIKEKVIFINVKPECIRTDNGIKHKFIQPGKPTQNSYVERFNGSYRRAILDVYIFRNIEEVRELTEKWRTNYNENRPHEALGNMTPLEYKHMLLTGEIRTLGHSVPAAEANP